MGFYTIAFPHWTWDPITEKYNPEEAELFSFDGDGGAAFTAGIVKGQNVGRQGREGGGTSVHFLTDSVEEVSSPFLTYSLSCGLLETCGSID